MKIWVAYGSEHSARLVMIGHFKTATDAKAVKAQIDRLEEQVRDDIDAGRLDVGLGVNQRFSDPMRELLDELHLYSLSPTDAEIFAYDYNVKVSGTNLTVETDEIDVAAFLKLMIDSGARLEVYSAPEDTTDAPASA